MGVLGGVKWRAPPGKRGLSSSWDAFDYEGDVITPAKGRRGTRGIEVRYSPQTEGGLKTRPPLHTQGKSQSKRHIRSISGRLKKRRGKEGGLHQTDPLFDLREWRAGSGRRVNLKKGFPCGVWRGRNREIDGGKRGVSGAVAIRGSSTHSPEPGKGSNRCQTTKWKKGSTLILVWRGLGG